MCGIHFFFHFKLFYCVGESVQCAFVRDIHTCMCSWQSLRRMYVLLYYLPPDFLRPDLSPLTWSLPICLFVCLFVLSMLSFRSPTDPLVSIHIPPPLPCRCAGVIVCTAPCTHTLYCAPVHRSMPDLCFCFLFFCFVLFFETGFLCVVLTVLELTL